MTPKAIEHLQGFLREAQNPEDMDPAVIAAVLDAEKVLTDWLKAVRTIALARVAAKQIAVPGYALKPGKRSRDWTDEAAAVAAMSTAGINDPYERKLLSVAEAEKKVPEAHKPLLEAAWAWRPGTPTLKKVDAAAPAPDTTPVFTPVDPASTNPYGW